MELSSIMASQLRELQQTVQMSVMQNALNLHNTAAVEMLREMPQQHTVTHPIKGKTIDVSV